MKTFAELAAHVVATAPNQDWRGRGRLLIGETHVKPIMQWSLDGRERVVGEAHVVAVRFEHPLANRWNPGYPFAGFFLARLRDSDVHDASPIVGDFEKKARDEKEYQGVANSLAGRFCPSCGAIDSVKQSHRRLGPEVVQVRRRCVKCGWTEDDIVD